MKVILSSQQPTLNFNLRNFKQKQTPIYAVVRYQKNGTFYQKKITTGEKVCPPYWDKKRQLINDITEFAILTNEKIMQIRLAFYEYLKNCKSFSIIHLVEEIEKITYKKMANKNPKPRQKTATKLFEQAYNIYYSGKKESTKNTKEGQLKRILKFYKEHGDSITKINQKGYNSFKEWLLQNNFQTATINQTLGLFAMLFNKVLCTNNNFEKYDFKPIAHNRIKQTKLQAVDTKKRPLNNEEIEKLFNVCDISNLQQKNLDVFKVQLLTGQRFSDLPKIFQGNFKIEKIGNIETWKLQTQKERTTSIIVATDELKEIVKKYNGKFPLSLDTNTANNNLKRLAEKAGLTKDETYQIQEGEKVVEKTAKTFEIISSHWFRYTFICKKIDEGFSIEDVAKMSGHANTEMIRQIYGKYAIEKNKARDVAKAFYKMENNKKQSETDTTTTPSNNQNDLINAITKTLNKDIDALGKLIYINRLKENGTTGLTPQELDEINRLK